MSTPAYTALLQRLRDGEVVLLDGGVGTEIQRQGAPMSTELWCAEANLDHPDIVRAVHRDYLAAGAEVVTANTFASSPLLLEHFGRLDEMERIDAIALAVAREAAADRGAVVAGSMSTMRPTVPGSDRTQSGQSWTEHAARALFARKAASLRAGGAEFIVMEMMRDLDYSLWACEAALASGLPVWIGISVERRADGRLVGFGRPDSELEPVSAGLAALQPDVLAIMHTSVDDTLPALEVLRRHWSGPTAAYPECGRYEAPDWQFIGIAPPDEYAALSLEWRRLGAHALGGCCGVGPAHIARLREEHME
ncbi:MAG: homocysteine S-methyltransferase family protein [Planctomycetota bacterium]